MTSPEVYERGLRRIVSSIVRNHPNATPPRVKSLNYLNNIMAKLEAKDAGADEAIMLNHLGNVAECTGDNLFIVKNGKVTTPPISSGALDGITRRAVMEILAEMGQPCTEAVMTRFDIYTADECFLTGTAAEVIPVAGRLTAASSVTASQDLTPPASSRRSTNLQRALALLLLKW